MQTRYLPTQSEDELDRSLNEAAEILRSGGVVAFPTETVYGLGVNADDEEARSRLYELKARPPDMPFTLHLAEPALAARYAETVPEPAQRLIERYWPGPLTVVLRDKAGGSVGLRVPSHDICRRFLALVEVTVAGTSANPHGAEPAVRVEQVRELFDGRIDAVIDGGATVLQQASTVVRFEEDRFEVVREGIITREMVHQLIAGRNILFVCTGNSCRSPMAEALFRKRLAAKIGVGAEDLGELGYKVHSAGIFAAEGEPASDNAVEAVRELGGDLRGHRTRPLTEALVEEADRIYALGTSHFQLGLQLFPWCASKLRMMGEMSITDPIGGDLDTYRECAREIDLSLRQILESY